MTKYAMAIDLESCIGCHACTIACKSEHDIPIGVWRCWVKEVEKGVFPSTRREFLPVLCNQCDDAPCQNICPTKALFRRSDGIVDLDPDWCIGCKSCIAACPYDQLFIDPNTMTAEKCNFCANRLEVGLEPACVVVCPTQCRVFGDVEDADSKISKLTTQRPYQVRKPEYNTAPNIYYLEGSRQLLDPTEAGQSGIYKQGEMDMEREDVVPEWENKPGDSRTVYDTFHEVPWETKIITYLLTKGASTGLLVISLFLWAFGFKSSLFSFWMPALSGILLAATGAVLVTDLKRPERFYYIMLRSNWGSWMAWGTWFIALDGALTLLWVLGAMFGATGFMGLISLAHHRHGRARIDIHRLFLRPGLGARLVERKREHPRHRRAIGSERRGYPASLRHALPHRESSVRPEHSGRAARHSHPAAPVHPRVLDSRASFRLRGA